MSNSDSEAVESLHPGLAFDLLADETRRRAVAALREDGAMSLGDLAEEIVARREDVAPAEVSRDRRERTAAMLHNAHLPKLEDAAVAEYDPEDGRIEPTEAVAGLEPYFEVIESHYPDAL